MKKFLTVLVIAVIAALCIGISLSYAGEIDILLQKLVEKGVLTAGEAQQIGTETKEQVKADIAEGKFSSLPAWVQNTKIKGDFRLRYEWLRDKYATNGSSNNSLDKDKSRARIRVRMGVDSKVNDKLKVGVGIATGSTDPRSRNVTLGLNNTATDSPADPKGICLDYAFAEYKPFQWATLYGGKFQNPLWKPYDMIWKGDITPEGLASNFSYDLNPKLNLFMNDMIFVLSNADYKAAANNGTKWGMLYALQPGFKFNFTENNSLKAAFAYYLINNVQGQAPYVKSSLTNTLENMGGTYTNAFNYNSINPSVELGFKEPFGKLSILSNIPYLAFFGDYIRNVSSGVTTSKSGFDAGIKFGSESVSDAGQWQFKTALSRLGRDAWLDIFTDADRYYGRTNTEGITTSFDYGLGKNTWLTVKYYNMKYLTKDYQGIYTSTSLPGTQLAGYAPEQLIQVDWNMKF